MPKKIFILDAFANIEVKALVAALCGVSETRLDAISDYLELEHRSKFSASYARQQLADHAIPHEIVILVGPESIEALGLEVPEPNRPFTINFAGGVHLGIYLRRPSSKKLTKPKDKLAIKRLMSQVVSLCDIPVTEKDARVVVRVVRDLGEDNISFWTNKILKEIEDKLLAGKEVDKYDLGQLMQCYANDVAFMRRSEE